LVEFLKIVVNAIYIPIWKDILN